MTPWAVAHQASLSFAISWSLLKLMSIESLMPSNHLVLCRPLLLLPSILPSITVFSNELALVWKLQYFGHLMALTSVLPMNIQGWCPLGLMFFQSERLSRVFSNSTIWKHQFFSTQPSVWSSVGMACVPALRGMSIAVKDCRVDECGRCRTWYKSLYTQS